MRKKDYTASANQQTLTDANLTVDAQRARDQAAISIIEPMEVRTVAAFLGRDDYQEVENVIPLPLAHLMLECLPAFTHERGGQVAWSMREGYRGQQVANAILHTAKVAGQTHLILHHGYLFMHLPDELVVVSAEPVSGPSGDMLKVVVCSNGNSSRFFEKWTSYARGHNYLRGQAFLADGTVIERHRRYGWEDILLPATAKLTVRRHVDSFLNNRPRLHALGIKMRRGLILAGPPGTGKTLLGKVLSDTLNVSFLWVLPRHVRGAESFEQIMSLARFVAPVVVFLEDLDLFAEERDTRAWLGLGELMNQLDGAVDNEDIVTIATTNRLEVIEKALRNRPGRFDRIIEIVEMDEICRRQLLCRLLAKAALKDSDLDYLVTSTVGYTGAHVEELANTLLILALDKVDQQPGGNEREQVSIDKGLIEMALQEVQVERKTRLGFHAA